MNRGGTERLFSSELQTDQSYQSTPSDDSTVLDVESSAFSRGASAPVSHTTYPPEVNGLQHCSLDRFSGSSDDDGSEGDSSVQTDMTDSDWCVYDEDDPIPSSRRNHDSVLLSSADIEICTRLDQEYDLALEEREIAYMARYQSVRQSACSSIVFMGLFMTLANLFFIRTASWTIGESMLFSVYTITTVGYGHLEHPETHSFQLYTIFFVLTGISLLTIMVAQVYQCLALEASRAQHSRDARLFSDTVLFPQSTNTHPSSFNKAESSNGEVVNGAESHTVGDANPLPATPRSFRSHISQFEIVQQHSIWIDRTWRCLDTCRNFLYHNEIGRGISVLLPFVGLITIGAAVIGPLEGWGFVESIYFSVTSLTTIGYGDYFPTRNASIIFCILWLPFSVGFMSLFLANVAAFYIRLSDKNIKRIERQLRRQLAEAKMSAARDLQEARRRALRGQELRHVVESDAPSEAYTKEAIEKSPSNRFRKRQGFDTLSTDEHDDDKNETVIYDVSDDFDLEHGNDDKCRNGVSTDLPLFGNKQSPINRRKDILRNFRKARRIAKNASLQRLSTNQDTASNGGVTAAQHELLSDSMSSFDGRDDIRPQKPTMSTMRDVLRTVRKQMKMNSFRKAGPESEFLSVRSSRLVKNRLKTSSTSTLKPSFALRSLVQERFSEIIAIEIAGYSSNVEIHDNTLTVTIDSLRLTADKWRIPRRARRAFRAVCFEALFFIGEYGLVVRGADALYDLSPIEFHGLFAPLLASMGDAETMEAWLASTEVLAEADLKKEAPLQWHELRNSTQSHAVVATRSKPLSEQLATPGKALEAAKSSMQYA